jgi:hypothetical protein
MLDANKAIPDKEGGLHKLFNKTSLVDAFSNYTETKCDIATYARGRKWLDYIFTSQALLPYIARLGYLPFYEANDGDHRGAFLDLDNSLMDKKIELQRPQQCYIGSSSKPRSIYKYKKDVDTQFKHHNIYRRAKAVFEQTFLPTLPSNFPKKLQSLDKQVTKSY